MSVTPPVHQCARLKIDAERKAGGMLEADPSVTAGRPNADSVSALQALGIEQHQSKRWQKVARVPPKVVDEHGPAVAERPTNYRRHRHD